jgi:nitrous oxidase accessory protein NosD
MFQHRCLVVLAVRSRALSLAAACLVTPAALAQSTWWVDASAAPGGNGTSSAPFQTIQQAIAAAASPMDDVRVRPGTYVENIDYVGKSIAVRSTDGALVTTIDGGATGSYVRMNASSPTLQGFTLRNGIGTTGSMGPDMGGGIYMLGTVAASVRDCVVCDNIATYGGGIACDGGGAAVVDCTIENNIGSSDPFGCQFGQGGGVWGPATLLLLTCNVRNNQTVVHGGGAYGGTPRSARRTRAPCATTSASRATSASRTEVERPTARSATAS